MLCKSNKIVYNILNCRTRSGKPLPHMLHLTAAQVRQYLPMPALIEALATRFQEGCQAPLRHHHHVSLPDGRENVLLLMPAWTERFLGVKQVMVSPDNGTRGLPAIHGQYQLSDTLTGQPLAMMDGVELTALRTVATSALAARYLARKDAATLLLVGTGRLAHELAAAHRSVRPIQRVRVWGRDAHKATELARELAEQGFTAQAVSDLPRACAEADIISCATLSREPLLRGEWLQPGCHLDLMGAYTPDRREADTACVLRSQLFVDSRVGALHEAGDLAIPLAEGVIQPEQVQADLAELCRGVHPGRKGDHEITLFKSVGLALEDLAAAILVYQQASGHAPAP